MSDELLIKCGSPTLAGLKTGNMFSYSYESREEVSRDLRRLNKILVPRGLRVIPLRYSDKTVLIYLYRIEALKEDLSQQEAALICAASKMCVSLCEHFLFFFLFLVKKIRHALKPCQDRGSVVEQG